MRQIQIAGTSRNKNGTVFVAKPRGALHRTTFGRLDATHRTTFGRLDATHRTTFGRLDATHRTI